MNHHESCAERRRIRHNGFLGKSKIEAWTLALKTIAMSLFALSERAKQNPCLRKQTGVLEFNLDDDLLSHG
ncbi:hypothetical protein L9Z73_26370, partial [Pseudomonas sp. TNT11]